MQDRIEMKQFFWKTWTRSLIALSSMIFNKSDFWDMIKIVFVRDMLQLSAWNVYNHQFSRNVHHRCSLCMTLEDRIPWTLSTSGGEHLHSVVQRWFQQKWPHKRNCAKSPYIALTVDVILRKDCHSMRTRLSESEVAVNGTRSILSPLLWTSGNNSHNALLNTSDPFPWVSRCMQIIRHRVVDSFARVRSGHIDVYAGHYLTKISSQMREQ